MYCTRTQDRCALIVFQCCSSKRNAGDVTVLEMSLRLSLWAVNSGRKLTYHDNWV